MPAERTISDILQELLISLRSEDCSRSIGDTRAEEDLNTLLLALIAQDPTTPLAQEAVRFLAYSKPER